MKTFRIGRKNIGTYNEHTGIFYKEVKSSKHLFRMMDAWGIDSRTLDSLPGTAKIVIDDVENRKRYETSKTVFDTFGEYFHFKSEMDDHQTQKFLRRSEFVVKDLEPEKQLTQAEKDRLEYLKFIGA